MSSNYRPLLLGMVAITILDVAAIYAFMEYEYADVSMWVFSILIYIVLGLWTTFQNNLRIALLFSGFLGIYDGTIGWLLSLGSGAYEETEAMQYLTFDFLIWMVFFSCFMSLFCGLIGGLIALMMKHKPSPDTE